jgi:hypothetical protein
MPTADLRPLLPGILGMLLAAPLMSLIPGHLLDAAHRVRDLPARWRKTTAEIALLAATPGPVACEMPELCYWAGKPFEVDFFNVGQKIKAGAIDPAPLLDRLDRHYYAAIEVSPNDGSDRIPDIVNQRIARNYQSSRRDDDGTTILVPR